MTPSESVFSAYPRHLLVICVLSTWLTCFFFFFFIIRQCVNCLRLWPCPTGLVRARTAVWRQGAVGARYAHSTLYCRDSWFNYS
jgi:hypothetical protein